MTHDVDEIARLAWAQLWQVTVVGLFIGTVVRLCGRERPRLAYALWMLVVVKSVVPPVWSSPTGVFSWASVGGPVARRDVAGEPRGLTIAPRAAAPVGGAPTPAANGLVGGADHDRGMDRARLRFALFSIWSTGLVLGTAFLLAKQIVCSTLIRRSSLPVDERYMRALADLTRRLDVRREVRVLVTSRPIGPAVFGLLRPSILLPEPLLSGTPPERAELILAHELIHVRRGDVLVGKLQLVAQLIWWFHPLVWWANREACRERERCCDEEGVSGVGCKPVHYARALLNVLEQKKLLRSLVALPGMRALEVTSLRLESIMRYAGTDHRRASRISRLVFGAGLLLLVPGTGATLSARSAVKDDAGVTIATQSAKTARRTLSGVVREKGTGRPVAGARVNVTVTDEAGGSSSTPVKAQNS